jgi:hypothetical protein
MIIIKQGRKTIYKPEPKKPTVIKQVDKPEKPVKKKAEEKPIESEADINDIMEEN